MASGPTFFRFSELTHENVNRDFQVHTNWTDGEGTIDQVLQAACNCGLAEIAFTEHARATSEYYTDFFGEIDRKKTELPQLGIYRGFEVKVIDTKGNLDISSTMRAQADIVLGSVHSFVQPDGSPRRPVDCSKAEAIETEFALAQAIIDGGQADVLSHAGGMCLRNFGEFPLDMMASLIEKSAQTGIAFEINTSYHAEILLELFQMLARHDPYVSIGSDVHRLEEMGRCRDAVRALLPR